MSTIEEGTPAPIKELLIEATFAPNRAIPSEVTAIDLGVLGQQAAKLHHRATNPVDGKLIEFMSPAYVTADRKLFLHMEGVPGEATHVSTALNLRRDLDPFKKGLPKQFQQHRFIAAAIHNHVIMLPPSPQDMEKFLFSEEPSDDGFNGHTAVFVSSAEGYTLVFRGENTPALSINQSREITSRWLKEIDEMYKTLAQPEMDPAELFLLQRAVQRSLLKNVASVFNLRIFSCPLEENIARVGLPHLPQPPE